MKQTLITDYYFKPVYNIIHLTVDNMDMENQNSNDIQTSQETFIINPNEEIQNLCLECGTDMGPQNPRQLCGKTYCYVNALYNLTY